MRADHHNRKAAARARRAAATEEITHPYRFDEAISAVQQRLDSLQKQAVAAARD